MIGFLEGKALKVEKEEILLNVGGVGYQVFCSESTGLETKDKSSLQLWIHTYVKEDKIELFGFLTQKEKLWFTSLIKINGIGPKIALKILSFQNTEDLAEMIEKEDITRLTSLPKVGKKMAEQMILALKSKLKKELRTETKERRENFPARKEMFSALRNLGFKKEELENILDKMNKNIDVQQGIREALLHLNSQIESTRNS